MLHTSTALAPDSTKLFPDGQNSTNSMLYPNFDLLFRFVVKICKNEDNHMKIGLNGIECKRIGGIEAIMNLSY